MTEIATAQRDVHLGRRLRDLRLERRLSINEVARRSGLSRNTLGNTERARFPNLSLATLFALMEVYGLRTLEEVFGQVPSRHVMLAWPASGRPELRER